MKSVVSFFSEVKSELTKVIWPKKDETIRLTLIVLAISALVGVFVSGFDYIFTKALGIIISH